MQEFQQLEQKNTSEINKKFDMYFHSALRNVGLYTSLSFAALAYSRVHRGTTPIYDMVLIAISMGFLLLSFTMNYVLNGDVKQHLEQSETSEKEKDVSFGDSIYIWYSWNIIYIRSRNFGSFVYFKIG